MDDEANILAITKQTLEDKGYAVITATDGAEAVGIYASHKEAIALVVTDMVMPFMDGTATIRALQKMNPDVRIIAVSGLKKKQRSFVGRWRNVSQQALHVRKTAGNDSSGAFGVVIFVRFAQENILETGSICPSDGK